MGDSGASALALLIIAVAGGLYFLPVIVAFMRRHPEKLAIFLLTLLLGWTFLCWVVALVWAASGARGGDPAAAPSPAPTAATAEIERLAALRRDGSLTAEEFETLKARALQR